MGGVSTDIKVSKLLPLPELKDMVSVPYHNQCTLCTHGGMHKVIASFELVLIQYMYIVHATLNEA